MSSTKVGVDLHNLDSLDSSEVLKYRTPIEGSPLDHFSSLLLSGDVTSTLVEVLTYTGLWFLPLLLYGHHSALDQDLATNMTFHTFLGLHIACSLFVRVYNSYCEACYFSFPQYRTQPEKEHLLKQGKDLMGRSREQLQSLIFHDQMTFLTQTGFAVLTYLCLSGFYPAPTIIIGESQDWYFRAGRLMLNHYTMSYGMYWTHRALHVNPFLWKHIHSIHHHATHPLSRNTYQDHWIDNLGNAIMGQFLAQILVPLDFETFCFSRYLRIMESLEKHSGMSCYLNMAHFLQRWLPFSQMPHHHDFHHEGHKGCNYTFAALGGIWDVVFGTRKVGRGTEHPHAATVEDLKSQQPVAREKHLIFDDPFLVFLPMALTPLLAIIKCFGVWN
jgi:sterol desaturase/sphingolipid hydroxylase (fatty acid hydroxylase superfamily)